MGGAESTCKLFKAQLRASKDSSFGAARTHTDPIINSYKIINVILIWCHARSQCSRACDGGGRPMGTPLLLRFVRRLHLLVVPSHHALVKWHPHLFRVFSAVL